MSLTGFGAFVPPPRKQKKKAASAASVNKPSSSRRRPLDDLASPIYGDELFQDSMKIERKIIISFFNLLHNNVRISTDFKFAIEWAFEPFEREIPLEEGGVELIRCCESYSLYYFKTIPSPLQRFDPETQNEFIIPCNDALDFLDCIMCDRTNNPQCAWCNGTKQIQTKIEKSKDFNLLKLRLVQIVKYEFFEEQRKFATIIPVAEEGEETNEQSSESIATNASLSGNALTSFSAFSPIENFDDKT